MAVKRTHDRAEIYGLGHLRLYRDDLEQIAKAVAEVGPLTISCPPWEFTDLADFSDPDLPERLPELTMTAETPQTDARVEVSLGRGMSRVTVTEPNTLTIGVLSRIRQVCGDRVTRYPPELAALAVLLVTSLGCLYLIGQVLDDNRPVVLIPVLVGWMLIFLVIALFVDRSMRPRRNTAVLINVYRAARPTFWERTRDDWAIEGVMLLVGAVLGGVIGYWVNTIT